MINKEKIDIMQMINDVIEDTVTQTEAITSEKPTWATPEEYRLATGKRFRLTKAESETFGDTTEGRQKAFEARRDGGLLVV